MAGNLNLRREVARVSEDHLRLRLKLHLGLDAGHGRLDADGLLALIQDIVNMGVEHVCAAVDGAQTREALGQLAESVERVDVWRFPVARDTVTVEPDPLER